MRPAAPLQAAPPELELGLEETLSILDAASTLRKERERANSILADDAVKAELRQRLLAAAQASGEALGPGEVDAAIRRYFERLHAFEPAPRGWKTVVAHLYIRRWKVGLILGSLLLWGGGGYWLLASPSSPLSSTGRETRRLESAYQELLSASQRLNSMPLEAAARLQVEGFEAESTALLKAKDLKGLTALAPRFEDLTERLEAEYELRIVSGQNRLSAILRDFEDQDGKRLSGYYAVVEAVDAKGRVLELPILDSERGTLARVRAWGEQIPEAVYQRLKADKLADGVLDERRFALKRRGALEPEILLPGADGRPIPRGRQIRETR